MTKNELQELVEAILEGASESLRKDGKLTHFALLYTAGKPLVAVPLDEVEPELQPMALRVVEEKIPGWMFVLHVSEAWYIERGVNFDKRVRPSQCIDRKECIVVEGKNRLGELISVRQPFGRDKNGAPVLEGEPQWWLDGDYYSRILRIGAEP